MLTTKQGMFRAEPGSTWFDAATASVSETTTFTVPSGIFEITVEAVGPGGNGGGVNTSTGSGGGGGAYVKGTIPVSPFEVLDLVIGSNSVATTVKRGATTLISCGAGGNGSPDFGTGAAGTYSTDGSVTVIAAANGATGPAGIGGSGSPGSPGGIPSGGGGGAFNGVGGAGASGGTFGRGGNGGGGNGGGGAAGATGTNSPGYPGSSGPGSPAAGGGGPGLMKISW